MRYVFISIGNILRIGCCLFFLSQLSFVFARDQVRQDPLTGQWSYESKGVINPALGISGEELEYDVSTGKWSHQSEDRQKGNVSKPESGKPILPDTHELSLPFQTQWQYTPASNYPQGTLPSQKKDQSDSDKDVPDK